MSRASKPSSEGLDTPVERWRKHRKERLLLPPLRSLQLSLRQLQLRRCVCHLGLQESYEVRIPPHGDVVQAQVKGSDEPTQEVYPLLKLGLSGVRLAK